MAYTSVILSGLPGSGKSVLVRQLSELLGWEKLSLGDFWKQKWRELYPHKEIPFEDYWRSTSREENLRINEEARMRFEKGKVVCDSRYSALYCQDLPALMVFVTAPLEVRVMRAMGNPLYPRKEFEEIKRIMLQREEDEVKRCKELFGPKVDFRDPSLYRFILDSNKLSIDEETDRILSYV